MLLIPKEYVPSLLGRGLELEEFLLDLSLEFLHPIPKLLDHRTLTIQDEFLLLHQ